MSTPLSWPAQVAAHAAYVEQRRAAAALAPAASVRQGKRRSPAHAERNREALLHALRDGAWHRFADIAAALPGLSRQGIYYLTDTLKAEGRIEYQDRSRGNRLYRLT